MFGPGANLNPIAEILLARPLKKPFRHLTGAVPIPHTTTRALPTRPSTAAVYTRTVRGRPRAAGAERFLDMFLGLSQAFLPSHAPHFAQKSPKRGSKSPRGLGGGLGGAVGL